MKTLYIAVIASLVISAVAQAQTWNLNGSGNWNTATNWTPQGVPNAVGAGVVLGTQTSASIAVTLATPITLGSLAIDSTKAYNVTGSQLIFDAAAGNASLTVSNIGSETISSAIQLNDTLVNTNTNTGLTALKLSGAITGTGGFTKEGSGVTSLTGTNTYSGSTQINAGTLSFVKTVSKSTGLVSVGANGIVGVGTGAAGYTSEQIDSLFANTLTGFSMDPGAGIGIDTSTADFVYATNISGTRSLSHLGTGWALYLTGTNTYTGNTIVNAGSMYIGNGGTAGSISLNSTIVVENNTAVIGFNRSDNLVQGVDFASGISGRGGISQKGPGTLTLNGVNTFSGISFVQGGILRAGSTTALGNNASYQFTAAAGVTLDLAGYDASLGGVSGGGAAGGNVVMGTANLTLTLDGSSTPSFGGVISGSGSLAKNGVGTQTFTGNNTYTGSTVINDGTLQIGNNGATGSIALVSGITVNGAGVIAFSRSDNLVQGVNFANGITGTGGFSKRGSGNLTLTGTNSFSGASTITAGRLIAGSATAIGNNAAYTLSNTSGAILDLNGYNIGLGSLAGGGTSGGNVALGGGTLTAGIDDTSTVYGGIISGTGGLTKIGGGTMTLSGNNSYTGTTTISGGTLRIGNSGTTGAIASGNIVNNAALIWSRITGGTNTAIAGNISGTGTLTKSGNGTLTLTGNNTYSGNTAVSAGTLQIGSNGTAGTLAGDAAVSSGATLAFNRSDSLTHSGVISGEGSLAKSGAGTLNLTGNNTLTGTTTVNAGTLLINGTSAGAVIVGASGTLGGTGTIAGNTTIQGTHSPGNSPGTQTFASNLIYSGASPNVLWQLVGNTAVNVSNSTFDSIVVGGTLNFSTPTALNLSFDSPGSIVDWSDGFWASSHTNAWLIYSAAGGISNFSNLSLAVALWNDSTAHSFAAALPGSSFSVSTPDNANIYLSYNAVPEQSTFALFVLGIAFTAFRIRAKTRRGEQSLQNK